MEYDGDYTQVFRQLAEHASAMEKGVSSLHNPWLIICPGTMRGVYGGGQVTALEERGLQHAFSGCIGVSTGAPTVAYYLAGQARLGTSIYCEECTWPEFISPRRLLHGGHAADIGFLANVFRGKIGVKKLDEARIRASHAQFFIAVTEYENGRGHLFDAKKIEPDIVHGLVASAAIPGMYRTPVMIRGRRFVDGGLSMPLPAPQALQKKPSCIVVFANCSRTRVEPYAKQCLTWLMLRGKPRGLKRATYARHEYFDEDLTMLKSSNVPYLIVWSDDEIGSYTRHTDKLYAAMARSYNHLNHLMDRAGI